MLSRARKLHKQAINLFNNKEYVNTQNLLRQARGYAVNGLKGESKPSLYKAHALIAEISANIAECLIYHTSLSDAENVPLEGLLQALEQAQEELKTTQEHLTKAFENVSTTYTYRKENANEVLSNLQKEFDNCHILLKKALMNIHFNHGVDQIKKISQCADKIENDLEQLPRRKLTQKKTVETEDFNKEVDVAIVSFRKSLEIAKQLTDQSDRKEIEACITELYERRGDLFSLMEENENLSQLKLEYLDFMLVEYSKAFHLANVNKDIKEALPLYLSVLNVLESKAKILNHQGDYQGKKAKDKLIFACIEMIKFIKKYPFSQFDSLTSPTQKLEHRSYCFMAHRLLAKHLEEKHKAHAHEEFALKEAEICFVLASNVTLSKDLELHEDVQNIKLYYSKRMMKQCLKQMTEFPQFSQNTIGSIIHVLSRIHRNGGNKLLNNLFMVSGKKEGVSIDIAMDLLLQGLPLTNNKDLLKLFYNSIKFLFETHKAHFTYVSRNNPHLIYSKQGQNNASLFSLVQAHFANFQPQKHSKERAKVKLLSLISEYFSEVENIFSAEQITHATPGILKECALQLGKEFYPQEVVDLFMKQAKILEDAIAGKTTQDLSEAAATKIVKPTATMTADETMEASDEPKSMADEIPATRKTQPAATPEVSGISRSGPELLFSSNLNKKLVIIPKTVDTSNMSSAKKKQRVHARRV